MKKYRVAFGDTSLRGICAGLGPGGMQTAAVFTYLAENLYDLITFIGNQDVITNDGRVLDREYHLKITEIE